MSMSEIYQTHLGCQVNSHTDSQGMEHIELSTPSRIRATDHGFALSLANESGESSVTAASDKVFARTRARVGKIWPHARRK